MTSKQCKLEFVREDDFVEYFLFPEINAACENLDEEFEKILEEIKNLLKRLQKDYIWHKDVIKLTIRTNSSEILLDDDTEKRASLPPHFYGITHYGENIQDEWFIVYLMNEITKEIPSLICKIVDSDGEFLLIEAAEHLPSWANPETCENRVFLVKGHMQLVQNSPSNSSSVLPVEQSLEKIRTNPSLYKVSNEIQKCIENRLENILEDIERNFHNQIVQVPLSIGCILEDNPDLIAPVVRSFCERDPIDLKVMRTMKYFPPEEERVRCVVKFTKCLYAMLQSSKYLPEKKVGWNLPSNTNSENYKEALLGVKIACGFEILASQAKVVGENLEEDRNWKNYLKHLQEKGYFNENLEGSAEYNRLLNEALTFYKENESRFRTSSQVGQTVVKYLKEKINDNIKQELRSNERNLGTSDSDNWMNITKEELDAMLANKYGAQKLFSANGEMDAKQFTDNINEFLEKKSEFDGIEEESEKSPSKLKKNPSMRIAVSKKNSLTEKKESDSNINFDPDSFSNHIKNLLDFVIPEDKWESNSELSEYSDDENLVNKLSDLSTGDLKSYMKQMDQELAQTTIGKSFQTKEKSGTDISDDDFEDIESFKPIDIDANTVKNMMDSYKSQMGASGPTSNLLNSVTASAPKKKSKKDGEDLSETTV